MIANHEPWLSSLPPHVIVVLFQDAMVHITGLLAEDLRQELYQLWEVCRFLPSSRALLRHLYINRYWPTIDHISVDHSPVCLSVQEYESQSSHEAKVVKELDQLEMILQAHEYEELEGNPGRLQEFFISTEGFITFPVIYVQLFFVF